MKICKICNQSKPIFEFGIHKTQPDGHNIYCKPCLRLKHVTPKARYESRRRSLKATYGLTLEQYDMMLKEQNGVCAICNNTNENGKPLSVDHKHKENGRRRGTKDKNDIRGLLCEHCNHGLGKFSDSIEILKKAVDYLQKYQSL